jgi:hypothetical protein
MRRRYFHPCLAGIPQKLRRIRAHAWKGDREKSRGRNALSIFGQIHLVLEISGQMRACLMDFWGSLKGEIPKAPSLIR